ncbi:MAG: hypothetical protein Q9217_002415 [Psora testacea]
MPLELREVHDDTEFNELIQCECESFDNPYSPFYTLLRPNRGCSPQGREGFKEFRDRQLRWHRKDPTSRWFKVVDTDIGDKIVGGACWNIYTENPHPKVVEHPLEADWWPEVLAICFVHPEHRHRGIGSTLVGWGVQKADELGIDAFVEATDDGKPLYEARGFVYMHTFYLDSARRNPSKKWMELANYVKTPVHCYFLWRPKGGLFVEGETVAPWEEKEKKG